MSTTNQSGVILTADSIDEEARTIAAMFDRFTDIRKPSLDTGQETRQFIFANDIDSTSAVIQDHANRTHQPKLTQLFDVLVSKGWNATLSRKDFVDIKAPSLAGKAKTRKLTAVLRNKLEQRKFRSTVGKQLWVDFITYGNMFIQPDYIEETDEDGNITFRGPVLRRLSPLNVMFNLRAESFKDAAKVTRETIHIADLKQLPAKFPNAGFDEAKIAEAMEARNPNTIEHWIQILHDENFAADGMGGWEHYFKQDMVELLIYRGDSFNPTTGEVQKNRVKFVVDRLFIIRDEPSISPPGFDGLHHAGARTRPDNLWAQGPLENLAGMQWRIDKVENAKADMIDLIINPPLIVRGEGVEEPIDGYGPGAVWYTGVDGDVRFLATDSSGILSMNTEIATYERRMEDYAGVPPESRGVRSPGEKTKFEVDVLSSTGAERFKDLALNFERGLETALQEAYFLMLINWKGSEEIELVNDITGEIETIEVTEDDIIKSATIELKGAKHWDEKRRKLSELTNLSVSGLSSIIAPHVDTLGLAETVESLLELENDGIIEEFAGIKGQVRGQIVAAEMQQDLSGQGAAPEQPSGIPEQIQGQGDAEGISGPGPTV